MDGLTLIITDSHATSNTRSNISTLSYVAIEPKWKKKFVQDFGCVISVPVLILWWTAAECITEEGWDDYVVREGFGRVAVGHDLEEAEEFEEASWF
jgi:hypothetical protein